MRAGSHGRFAALLLVLLLPWRIQSAAHAHPGCSSGPTPKSSAEKPAESRMAGALPLSSRPPHNGKIYKGAYHSFEVVYLPHETRVYIYGPTDRPAKAKDVQGQITMQVRGNPTLFQNPLRYLPPIPGSSDGDCLQALVDVTQIHDGDMQVTVELSNLPYDLQEPRAQLRQIFALTRTPQAENEAFVAAGNSLQAVQRTGNELTSWDAGRTQNARASSAHAACCEDCKKEPDGSLEQVARPDAVQRAPNGSPALRAEQTTADDRLAIESQRFCPVMRQPLSARGTPWKVLVDGQPVFVCCRECISQVEMQPAAYLAEARRLRGW